MATATSPLSTNQQNSSHPRQSFHRSPHHCSSNSSSGALSWHLSPTSGYRGYVSLGSSLNAPCRFIPSRSSLDINAARWRLTSTSDTENDEVFLEPMCPKKDAAKQEYRDNLKDICGARNADRVLNFTYNVPSKGRRHSTDDIYHFNMARKKAYRILPSSPEKVLDLPGIRNDYYSHLLDWSSTNYIATALEKTIYVLNADDVSVSPFPSMSSSNYLSLAWSNEGKYLAAGTSEGVVQIWDAHNKEVVHCFHSSTQLSSSNPSSPVTLPEIICLEWNPKSTYEFALGNAFGSIQFWDIRKTQPIYDISAHTGYDVCGMKFNNFKMQNLLASGGGNYHFNIWDLNTYKSIFSIAAHESAVRALSWNPTESCVLATGGGYRDGTIRFWNVRQKRQLGQIATKSQVLTLLWNKRTKELVSSHWSKQKNMICLWKYPSLKRCGTLNGHTARILHMAFSPCHQYLASASADESLCLWNFAKEGEKERKPLLSSPLQPMIR